MRKLYILLYCLLATTMLSAQTLSEASRISLLTCTPGYPLYLHFGHSAIRVEDPLFTTEDGGIFSIDWTFNYGLFSFDTEHFYWKFVRGETDYQLGLQTTRSFWEGSAEEGRTVYEQELCLSPEQRQRIFDALLINYEPENRVYRYNFVFDNCATRPLKLIADAVGLSIPTDTLADSWRKQITYYAGHWSWGEYGINLAFGLKADRPMTLEESLFLPENLMHFIACSQVDGHPMAGRQQTGVFTPRDSNFWTSPYLCEIMLILLLAMLTWAEFHKKKRFTASWALDGTLMIAYLLVSLILTFLIFFSTHPFVRENMNYLIFLPLWIVPCCCLFTENGHQRIQRMAPYILAYLTLATAAVLLSPQTFHYLLLLPLAHILRLYILSRYAIQ